MGYPLHEFSEHVRRQVRAKDRGKPQKTKVGTQRIVVPQLAPGLNGDNGLKRMHWKKYMKVRDRWVWLVRQQNPAKHPGKVTIRYTRKSTAMMDPDNVGASFKVIGDALETLGVIENDSFDIITDFRIGWSRAKNPASQKSIIEITDVTK